MKKVAENNNNNISKKQLRQTDLPKVTLEEALKIPQALWDQYAGNPTQPVLVAQAINISPSSSKWRMISGAAIAYGLTSGGYNSQMIALTDLGKRIVAPTIEGDNHIAITEAIQKPTYLEKFYTTYGKGNKLPSPKIAENILTSWGIPKDNAKDAFDLIKTNGEFANVIITIKGNQYVQIDNNSENYESTSENLTETESPIFNDETLPTDLLDKMNIHKAEDNLDSTVNNTENNNVFISHGKNKQIVEQLKQLLEFGTFNPIISVERETTAISVPDKVFNDMRLCSAGVIHIEGEKNLLDVEGNEYNLINENVLIEIGAAIALFKNKVILLCKEGTNLPSNLQGLYRCEYSGKQLDYGSTMKLLKTFSEFRKG